MRLLATCRLRLGHSWTFAMAGLLACLNISCAPPTHSTDVHTSPANQTDDEKLAESVSHKKEMRKLASEGNKYSNVN